MRGGCRRRSGKRDGSPFRHCKGNKISSYFYLYSHSPLPDDSLSEQSGMEGTAEAPDAVKWDTTSDSTQLTFRCINSLLPTDGPWGEFCEAGLDVGIMEALDPGKDNTSMYRVLKKIRQDKDSVPNHSP